MNLYWVFSCLAVVDFCKVFWDRSWKCWRMVGNCTAILNSWLETTDNLWKTVKHFFTTFDNQLPTSRTSLVWLGLNGYSFSSYLPELSSMQAYGYSFQNSWPYFCFNLYFKLKKNTPILSSLMHNSPSNMLVVISANMIDYHQHRYQYHFCYHRKNDHHHYQQDGYFHHHSLTSYKNCHLLLAYQWYLNTWKFISLRHEHNRSNKWINRHPSGFTSLFTFFSCCSVLIAAFWKNPGSFQWCNTNPKWK